MALNCRAVTSVTLATRHLARRPVGLASLTFRQFGEGCSVLPGLWGSLELASWDDLDHTGSNQKTNLSAFYGCVTDAYREHYLLAECIFEYHINKDFISVYGEVRQADRAISTSKLHVLLHFHT